MKVQQKPLPTEMVEIIDRGAVLKQLKKGPVNYACTFEQYKSIVTFLWSRDLKVKVRSNRVDGEVIGYRFELTGEAPRPTPKLAKKRKRA